jgi:small subunit ribosomal protein S6
MERYFRLDERVMRYLSVLIDEEADLEQLKEEASKEEAAPAEAEETPEAADDSNTEEEVE